MLLERPGAGLVSRALDRPLPGPGQILLRVEACGVCRTDLHVQAGELPRPKLPLVLGHEIVGSIEELGPGEGRGSASRGWVGPAVSAVSAGPGGKICVSTPSSRAMTATAATPSTPSRM